jgi:hypothetical protein
MRLFIVLLFGQRLLNLSQVNDLARLFWSRSQRPLNAILKVIGLLIVTLTCFILNAYGLTFEFLHLLVPVFIEFIELLQMSLLYLAFFALMLLAYLLFSLAL